MMNEHFKVAIESLDILLLRKMWQHIYPNMPQPQTDEQALARAHYARTIMNSVKFELRAYSHSWLLERAFPSGLPDLLRPKAQRIYPITVGVVGISVNGTSEIGKAVAPQIQGAMSYAVEEAYADGHKDQPDIVRSRMQEARKNAVKKLIGKII